MFSGAPVTPGDATRELIQLQESAQLRVVLRQAFQTAFQLASAEVQAQLASFIGQPLSSAQLFATTLQSWFNEDTGFRVECCEVARAWEITPLQGPDLVYRSCLVGEQRHLPHLPGELLCSDAVSNPLRETLVELGVLTFVATRLAD